MFWVLHPEDTFYEYLQLTPEERTNKWRIRKDQLEMIIGRTWERHSWSQDALGPKNFVLNEYWHIFAHDWPVERNAVNSHADAQPKSVFFHALTSTDNVLGWAPAQERDRIPICRVYVDLHKSSSLQGSHAARSGDRTGWKTKV